MNAGDVTAGTSGTSVYSVDPLAGTATERKRTPTWVSRGEGCLSPDLQRKSGVLRCGHVDSCSYGQRSLWTLVGLNLQWKDLKGDCCLLSHNGLLWCMVENLSSSSSPQCLLVVLRRKLYFFLLPLVSISAPWHVFWIHGSSKHVPFLSRLLCGKIPHPLTS